MQSEHPAGPATGPGAVAASVPTRELEWLNAFVQKLLYFTILIGGIGVPVLAWLYVALRGLFS